MSDRSSQKPVPLVPSGSTSTPQRAPGDSSRSRSQPTPGDGQMTVISSRPPAPNSALLRGGDPPIESGSLLEGEHLGQFLLQKFVGGGGMGVVFRALDTTLNREVAVKVLSRDQSADEETLRRFRNEAQSAARLNHENIAHVHYVGEDRGVHYIVFEFVEGVNIRDLVAQKGPLPLEEAISYTYQIAQALEHASQRAVIHRDIKPSNVLITPDGKAKLVDMGLARLNQVAHTDQDLTASGVTLGTFDYISPEQARDPRSADVRSDLYSLGCSFFFMLTGRPPFPDGTVLQKLLQHQADHPPDPRSARPELPVEVTRILARLLAKNPAQRHQQPHELIDDLAALGETLGMQLSASRPVFALPRSHGSAARWQVHLPWAVPLAALFVIVIALDVYWSGMGRAVVSPAHLPTGANHNAPSASERSPAGKINPSNAPGNVDPPPGPRGPALPPPKANPAANEPDTQTEPLSPATALDETPLSAPDASRPWLERLARSFGTDLDFRQWAARARPAPDKRPGTGPASIPAPTGRSAVPSAPRPDAAVEPVVSESPPRAKNLLIVGDEPGARTYASLHAACNDAKNGDVIELRYNGRKTERPIALPNVRLTIRAGEQYQPVVVFRPQPDLVPLKYPTTMFSIAGGQLVVEKVHWELALPRNVPPDWTLFETRRSELVQFRQCTFTILNASLGQTAYHAGVAFFDIKAPPGTGSVAMDPDAMEERFVTIDLQNCVARGEAVFLRANDLQAVRLNWDNGLLATSEQLLIAAGGPTQPRQMGHVQLQLRHLTAMIQGGLAQLTNSTDAPYQLTTEIDCENSILLSTARPPLVEQRGSDTPEEFLSRLQWSGNRDFFDGFEVFWQIVDTAAPSASKQMRFDDWQAFWLGQSRAQLARKNAVVWRGLPSAARAFHRHTPADYALDLDAANNPALGAASDGMDAGCISSQLPTLPLEQDAEQAP